MYVKAIHPRVAHQLWEVPPGQTVRYGVITPPVGEHDSSTSDWTWTELLHSNGVPALELWVNGDPDVYTDGPMTPPGEVMPGMTMTTSGGEFQVRGANSGLEAPRHYFIKYATWWDTAKSADVTVITGTDGDIFVMGDNGRTLDKVG